MKIENTPPYLQDIFNKLNSGELIADLKFSRYFPDKKDIKGNSICHLIIGIDLIKNPSPEKEN